MNEEMFSLIQECTNSYFIETINTQELEIHIKIPKRFKYLWMAKLSELRTTEKEIEEFEK
jgi:hypothetical protein